MSAFFFRTSSFRSMCKHIYIYRLNENKIKKKRRKMKEKGRRAFSLSLSLSFMFCWLVFYILAFYAFEHTIAAIHAAVYSCSSIKLTQNNFPLKLSTQYVKKTHLYWKHHRTFNGCAFLFSLRLVVRRRIWSVSTHWENLKSIFKIHRHWKLL